MVETSYHVPACPVTAALLADTHNQDMDTVLESLKAQGCSIETIDFKDGAPDKSVAVTLTGNLVEKSTELHIYETLKALECVNNVDVKYLITD